MEVEDAVAAVEGIVAEVEEAGAQQPHAQQPNRRQHSKLQHRRPLPSKQHKERRKRRQEDSMRRGWLH